DLNDNFVCQVRGTKRWRIAPNAHVRYPTVRYVIGQRPNPVHEVEAPRGLPTEMPQNFQTVELRPGMVMFVPRGMWHDTETIANDESGAESLHFNIQLGIVKWKHAIEFLLLETTALYGGELRAPMLGAFDGSVMRDEFVEGLKSRLRAVVEDVVASDIPI